MCVCEGNICKKFDSVFQDETLNSETLDQKYEKLADNGLFGIYDEE